MPDPVLLRLPADCSIRTVRALQADLIAALGRADSVALDCAPVERVDVAFVQLVLVAAATAERQGKRVGLTEMPTPVAVAFRRAGVPAPVASP